MNADKPIIRKIRGDDFDSFIDMLAEMARGLAMEERLWIIRDDVEDRDIRLERLRDALLGNPPLFEALILEIRGRAVGFCTFHTSFSTWRGQPGLFLEDLFVRDSHRKSGLGERLMSRLARIARERDCHRIVWNVPEDDENVHRFYKRLGARELKEATMILREASFDDLASKTREKRSS